MQNHVEHNQLITEIWQQLQRASVDRHHEWRNPVLITNSLIGEQNQWPEARTVILRSVSIDTKQLTFYTDSRSPKVAQIAANPHATLVFWSKRHSQQLRVKVNISVIKDTDLTKKTWHIVKQSPSASDYLSDIAPGEKLDDNTNMMQKTTSSATVYFAMLIAEVVEIDWLALSRDGHQRAKIDANGLHHLVP